MTELPLTKPCHECGGSELLDYQSQIYPHYLVRDKSCPTCFGRGYLPILYTPEQWVEAGGELHDEMSVFIRHANGFNWWYGPLMGAYAGEETIISTPYITRKDLEEI